MKLKLIFSAALIASVMSATAASQNAGMVGTNASSADAMKALFGDPVVVKAKGFEIKRSELDEVLAGAKASLAAQGQTATPEVEVGILNQLMAIQLLLQKATDADRAAGKVEADLQFTNLLKRFPSPEAFDQQLKAVGMTVANLRAKATQEATATATLKRELHIAITDEDAKDYYAKNPDAFEQPELAHVRLILLLTIDPLTRSPLLTNTIASKRKQIDDLRKRALAGEDFVKLAKEFSEDPGSKENGGELPEFARGSRGIPPEFEAAAFSLTNNQVSDVIVTEIGFQILQSLGKTPAKKIDYATVETDIKNGLGRVKIAKLAPGFIQKLRAEYNVEILDANLKLLDEKMQAEQAAAEKAAAALAPAAETGK